MKPQLQKLPNVASPFIMLLIPLFLLMGVLALNIQNDIPAEKASTMVNLRVPTLKNIILSVIK